VAAGVHAPHSAVQAMAEIQAGPDFGETERKQLGMMHMVRMAGMVGMVGPELPAEVKKPTNAELIRPQTVFENSDALYLFYVSYI
jgi:hypothetical protein